MDQPPPPLLVSNDDDNNNVEIVGSITNGYDYYSNGLLQQGDTHQQNPCSCNNCISAAGSFQLHYDNDSNYMDMSESPSPMQHHMIEQSSPISQKEQHHINDQQFIDHIQPQPVQDFPIPDNTSHLDSSNTTINSQTSYTELFRIEISGVEIIFRKKFLLNLNHNLNSQQPQNEKPLGNRPGRIQNRVHPYLMPECRYNKINYRNPTNSVPKQYYTHLSPMTPQLNQQIIDSYQ
jgi:hypothetical protein